MQDRPVCFECDRVVEHDPVYEAPCGHEAHASAVFHGLCLMRWREKRHALEDAMALARERWLEEHGEHDPRKE